MVLGARPNSQADLWHNVVGIHLPAPEAIFLSGKAVRTASLDEALAEHRSAASALSPFAECAVLATLHGRCMVARRAGRRNRDRDRDRDRDRVSQRESDTVGRVLVLVLVLGRVAVGAGRD